MDGSTIRFSTSLFSSEHWDNPDLCPSPVVVSLPTSPAVQDLEERVERDGAGIQVIKIPGVNIVDASVPTSFAHAHVSPDVVGANGVPVGIAGTTPGSLSPEPVYHDSLLISSSPRVDAVVRRTLDTCFDAAIISDFSKANSSLISLPTPVSTAALQITLSASSPATKHPDQCPSLTVSLSNDDASSNSSGSDSESTELTIISPKLSPTNVGFPAKNPAPLLTSPGECSLSGVPAILSLSAESILTKHLSMQICKSPEHPHPMNGECGSAVSSVSGPLHGNHPGGLYDDLDTWVNNIMIPTTHGDPSKPSPPPLLEVKRRKDEPHSSDSPNWANAPPIPVRSRIPDCTVDTVQPINGRIDDMYISIPNSGTVTYDHTPWNFSGSDMLISEGVVDATLLSEMRRRPMLQLTSPRSSASTASYTPAPSLLRTHGADTAGSRIPMPILGPIWDDIELMQSDPRLTSIISVANIAQVPPHSNIDQSLLSPEVKNRSAPPTVDWQDMIAATSDIAAEDDYHRVSRGNFSTIPNVPPFSESQSSVGLGPSHISSGSKQLHQSHPPKNCNPPRNACDYSNLNHNNEPLLQDAAIQKHLAPSQDVPQKFSLRDDKIPTTHSQWIALAELVAQRGTPQHPPTQESKTRFDDAWIHDVNYNHDRIAQKGGGTNYKNRNQPYDAGNASPNDRHLSVDAREWHRKTKRSKPQERKFDPQHCDPISTLHPQGTAQSIWADPKAVYNTSKTTH